MRRRRADSRIAAMMPATTLPTIAIDPATTARRAKRPIGAMRQPRRAASAISPKRTWQATTRRRIGESIADCATDPRMPACGLVTSLYYPLDHYQWMLRQPLALDLNVGHDTQAPHSGKDAYGLCLPTPR